MKRKYKMISISKLLLAIYLGVSLSKGALADSSVATPGANSKNSRSADLLLISDQNSKKSLDDRVKELELQFQLHVSESKAESEDQYENIVILKAAKKSQEEKFKLILDKMEVLQAQNQDQISRIEQLENILKTKSDTSSATSSIQSVTKYDDNNGPYIPSSCEDLKSRGHHLNGIYMVFNANVKKVLAIYCDFQQSYSASNIVKRVVGSLGINTLVGGVYFYAQMINTFKEVGKIVHFDRILVNQGNGLSSSNKGVFTAPRAGIYHFTFKGNNWGLSVLNTKLLMIEMRHNGLAVGDTASPIGLLHVHATLKLKVGDKITIFKATAGDLYTDLKTPDTHFSGWLMEEDVSIM